MAETTPSGSDCPVATFTLVELADLADLADLAAAALWPPARGISVGNELRQFADIPVTWSMPLSLADACAGYAKLGVPREGDEFTMTARRTTCAELGALASIEGGNPSRLAAVLRKVGDAIHAALDAGEYEDDEVDRWLAIGAAAIRESGELDPRPVVIIRAHGNPPADARRPTTAERTAARRDIAAALRAREEVGATVSEKPVTAETITDDHLRVLFAAHCECRPLDLARTEDEHSHDCDTAILDDIQTALCAVDNEERGGALFRCAEHWNADLTSEVYAPHLNALRAVRS